MDLILRGAELCPDGVPDTAACCILGLAGVPNLDENVRLGGCGMGALEGPPDAPPTIPPAPEGDGDTAGTSGRLAMAAGRRGGVASSETAAERGVFVSPLSEGATGP